LGDVLDGYVSVQAASDDYGVVIHDSPPAINQRATAQLRQLRRRGD